MILPTFILSAIAFLSFWLIQRKWAQETSDTNSMASLFKISMIKGLCKFFGILMLVALIYVCLEFWLNNRVSESMALSTAQELESAVSGLKEHISPFKLGYGLKATILWALIFFATMFPVLERYNIRNGFKKFNKLVSYLLYIFTIISSFTFLGHQLAGQGETHIAQIQVKLKEVEKQEAIVRGQETKELYQQIETQIARVIVHEALKQDDFPFDEETIRSEIQASERPVLRALIKILPRIDRAPLDKYRSRLNRLMSIDGELIDIRNALNTNHMSAANRERFHARQTEDRFNALHKEQAYSVFHSRQGSVIKAKKDLDGALRTISKPPLKYEDVLVELVKGGNGLLNNALLQGLQEESPLLYALIKPFLLKPVEEFLTERSKEVFRATLNGEAEITAVLKAVAKECETGCPITQGAFSELDQALKHEAQQIRQFQEEANSWAIKAEARANRYLDNRWEDIRQAFSKKLEGGSYSDRLNSEQLSNYRDFFESWERIKSVSKYLWAENAPSNEIVDAHFYDFIEDNALHKACWGFILQQEDWAGFEKYFYDGKSGRDQVTGQPFYLLEYYCKEIGTYRSEEYFETNFYDNRTNEMIGIQCPTH